MLDFGLVLSIEHSSTLRQHVDSLALAVLAATKDRKERTYAGHRQKKLLTLATAAVDLELKGSGSAVVSTAVKAICCRHSDGGVLNF